MGDIVCLNGRFLPREEAAIPADDRGFLYGFGLFETVLVLAGRPVLWPRHYRRLAAGCRSLGLPAPADPEELIQSTVERNGGGDGALRVTWSAGIPGGEGNLVITARPLPHRDYGRGYRAGWAGARRNETSALVRHKTTCYLENLLAREKARHEGFDEVLFLNTAGRLAEASAGNVFLIRGRRLVTPDEEQGLLPGIVRGLVLELAPAAGLVPEERAVEPRELAAADEVFLTNSLLGVMPLVEVSGQAVGRPGEKTAVLRRLVEQVFRAEAAKEGTSRQE